MPLSVKGPDRFDASKTLRREVGCLAQEDRSRLGRLLKSCGDIGRVADHRVIHRQSGANRTKDHRAAVDAHAHKQVQSLASAPFTVAAERLPNGDCSQQSTPYMVLVRQRGPEKSQKPVAGKLRRRAAIAMHLGEARLQKCADEIAHRLGPEALGQRCRVHDVAEQHADLLHFAGKRAFGGDNRRRARPGRIRLGYIGHLPAQARRARPRTGRKIGFEEG